eukprot:5714351-Pleurochrysis_carterae.AAC.5
MHYPELSSFLGFMSLDQRMLDSHPQDNEQLLNDCGQSPPRSLLVIAHLPISTGLKSPKICLGYMPGIWRIQSNVPIFLGFVMDGKFREISKIFA